MLEKFEKIATTRELCDLAKKLPNDKEELFVLLVLPGSFERLVTDLSDLLDLTETFPNHKEDLFKLLVQPDNFKRIISGEDDLAILAQKFPNQVLLKKATVKDVFAEILNSREQKAYIRGAAIGFFANMLSAEVAYHIGTFLDRKTGAMLAQATKNAAALAQSKHDDKLPKPL